MPTTGLLVKRSALAATLFTAAVAASGCYSGGEYEGSVQYNINASSTDVDNGKIDGFFQAGDAAGEEFFDFIAKSVDNLGGSNPAKITTTRVSMLLSTSASGVAKTGDIFAGACNLSFKMTGGNEHPFANKSFEATAGAGPISFTTDFNSDNVEDNDFGDLLHGTFQIHYDCGALAGYENANAIADILLTVHLQASN